MPEPTPHLNIATVAVTDRARLVLPTSCLTTAEPFAVRAGDRLVAVGDTGDTAAGTIHVNAGVPVLLLDCELEGETVRATVRRPRTRSAA